MFSGVLENPLPGFLITSGWGDSRSYRGGWHEGTDHPAPLGTPIVAAGPGIVTHHDTKDDSFAGKWIAINHGNGLTSRYLHMDQVWVGNGASIMPGTKIGTVGTTGTARSGPHLHFDVKIDPGKLSQYMSEFGTPTTGFGRTMSGLGTGVPTEPLLRGAKYTDQVLANAAKQRVPVFHSSWIEAAAVVAVLGWLVFFEA